jgi:hypothetical protein
MYKDVTALMYKDDDAVFGFFQYVCMYIYIYIYISV